MLEEKKFAQVHIIPFDIGYSFYDELLIDNYHNLKNMENFFDKIEKYYINANYEIIRNYELQVQNNKVTKFYCKKNKASVHTVGIIKFAENLFCYILKNGIGVFVIYDSNNEALKNSIGIEKHSIVLMAACEKKIAQSTILNQYDGEHIFTQYEEIMLDFRELCWKTIREIVGTNNEAIRKFSSNKSYKSNGLSYVLTIHIFRENTITHKKMKSLMYSYLLSGIIKSEDWESIEQLLEEEQQEYEETTIDIMNQKIYFAWSGVSVITNDFTENYEQLLENAIIANLIKAEIYIQSMWFIADNSMDNINKNTDYNLENLQKIASMIEFSQAEIENEISANMDTLYKKILQKVIQSSEVKKIYQSVSSQINIHKKIKEAYYEDIKSKNRFLVNAFLAIFTACSLYEAVYEMITSERKFLTITLFTILLIISVVTVWIQYKNR